MAINRPAPGYLLRNPTAPARYALGERLAARRRVILLASVSSASIAARRRERNPHNAAAPR
jgi:hypothetical protein